MIFKPTPPAFSAGGRQLLALACQGGHPAAVEYLLKSKLVLAADLVDNGDPAPLHMACRHQRCVPPGSLGQHPRGWR